ncbi:MAG: hypothetical protein ABI882_14835, partial [Acidobacteriota bacterium]
MENTSKLEGDVVILVGTHNYLIAVDLWFGWLWLGFKRDGSDLAPFAQQDLDAALDAGQLVLTTASQTQTTLKELQCLLEGQF